MFDEEQTPVIITDPRHDRYASLHLIDWWNQELVQKARVMVVGAGALGNEVLKNLALLGIGYLFIVDYDTIEASNLTRSVLFRMEDGGRSKAAVAAERIRLLNPDVHVIAFEGDITRAMGIGVYRQMDVVISCLDNRAARMAINRACINVRKPWIDGALAVLSGLVRVFDSNDGACYECTMTDEDYRLVNFHYSCPPGFAVVAGREPTMPTTASIIAAMQIQEAVKLLHGLPVLAGHVTYYSGETLRLTRMSYPRKEECPAHNPYETIIELPCSINNLTLEGFVQAIKEYLDKAGTIFLPKEIVTICYCPACHFKERVYRPYNEVVPDRLSCPHCGTQRIFDATSSLATSHPVNDIPLTQLAIPPLHILPVRTGNRWLYFELSADKQFVLSDWQK